MAWHDRSCELDLEWEKETPGCARCGIWAPRLKTIKSIPLRPPSSVARSQLKCTWPPSVSYTKSVEAESMTFIQNNIDSWELGNDEPECLIGQDSEQCSASNSQAEGDSPDNTATSSVPSIYDALPGHDSIRVLVLHGAEVYEAPIHCSLEIRQFDDPTKPMYEALSYTWADASGNADRCYAIFLGPQYDILLVTRNCVSALRAMRTRLDRLLWVDAICINQFDIEERNKQVALMRGIFSSASRALVYLGEQNAQTNLALQLLRSKRSPPAATELEHSALEELFNRPYWNRLWVVQEILLAGRISITCGESTASWPAFRTLPPPGFAAERTKQMIPRWLDTSRHSIYSLLMATMSCRCSDPRDKVFALLGLPRDLQPADLPVDYSLSVSQVYTGITSYLLKVQNNTDFVRFLAASRQNRGLPSWVPDWSNLVEGELLQVSIRPDLSHIRYPEIGRRRKSHWRQCWTIPASQVISPGRLPEAAHELQITSDPPSLVLTGYRVLSFTRGSISITSVPQNHLYLANGEIWRNGLGRSLEGLGDTHCFWVPTLESTVLLKHHGHGIYTLMNQCSVEAVGSQERYSRIAFDGMGNPLSAPDYMYIEDFATKNLKFAMVQWVRNSVLLRMQVACSLAFDPEQFNQLWPSALLSKREQIEKRFPQAKHQTPILEDHFKSVKAMHDEILEIFTEADIQVLKRIGDDHNASRFHSTFEPGIILSDSAKRMDHRLQSVRSNWDTLNESAEVLVPRWQRDVEELKKATHARKTFTHILQDNKHALRRVVTIDHFYLSGSPNALFEPILRVLGGPDNSRMFLGTLPLARIIYLAWKSIGTISFDSTWSWEWIRYHFRTCLVTLKMVAQVIGALRHLQILERLSQTESFPERIIIV